MKQAKILLIGGALLVGSLGTAGAFAQTAPPKPQTQMQEPNFTGSIALPQDSQSEGAEAAAYGSMAKVALDQAVKAARDSLGVTDVPTSAQLDNENGFLIGEVVIGNQAVKVDAGNAQVLQTEQVGAEDKADETNPTVRAKTNRVTLKKSTTKEVERTATNTTDSTKRTGDPLATGGFFVSFRTLMSQPLSNIRRVR